MTDARKFRRVRRMLSVAAALDKLADRCVMDDEDGGELTLPNGALAYNMLAAMATDLREMARREVEKDTDNRRLARVIFGKGAKKAEGADRG